MPYKDPIKRKEYHANYSKIWNTSHKENLKFSMKKHDQKRKTNADRIKETIEAHSRSHHRQKIKVLKLYGVSCKYCNESRYELLTIDHINNDGAKHRKMNEYKKYSNMWGYLSHTEYKPDLYQVLCFNCNCAKYFYKIEPGFNDYKSLEYWEDFSKLRNPFGR